MSETVKLIIEIPTDLYKHVQGVKAWFLEDSAFLTTIKNGIPLDSNSERAEVQAYFAGQTYGWEEGRKALIDDVKAEIAKKAFTEEIFDEDIFRSIYTESMTREEAEEESVIETEIVKLSDVLEILDNIGKGDKE